MRTLAVLLCALAAASVAGCSKRPAETPAEAYSPGWMRAGDGTPPNVLLISIDTMRHDHTGWTGRWEKSFTPALDELATKSTRFGAATTPATATRPAVASLFTGLYPGRHPARTNSFRLGTALPRISTSLANAGYQSAGFTGNGLLDQKAGFLEGFATSEVFETYFGSLDSQIADAGIEWLAARDPSRPFFLWLHMMDPHGPYLSAPAEVQGQVPFDDGLGGGELAPHDQNYGNGVIPRYQVLRASKRAPFYRRRYRAEVHWADRQIGRVLAALERAGLDRSTLVILTADHGESLGEHDAYFQHGWYVYEPSANVPLAFALPGKIPAGQSLGGNASLVDVFPTLLAGLGLPTPAGLEGEDLGPLLRGIARENPRGPVFVTAPKESRIVGVRDGRFKLIYTPAPVEGARAERPFDPPGWQLFDLAADPGETRDVSAEHPAVTDRLKGAILEWMRAHKLESPASSPKVDPATEERLRQLGYIE